MAGTFTIVETNTYGQETAEHGTALLPVQQYHNDFSIMDTVEWHWHPEFEAGIVMDGQLSAMINQDEFHLSQGDGFFINSQVLHADWDRRNHSCQLDSIVFHPRLVGGSHDSIFWQNYIHPVMNNRAFYGRALYTSRPEDASLLDCIRQAISLCDRQEPGYAFLVRHALSQLLYQIFCLQRHYTTGLSESVLRNEERIKIMISFIEAHFQQPVTLQEIAASAAISKSECIRCFSRSIGRTPIQFLKEFRLQKAAVLLYSTDMSIGDIAFSCGFSEMSYFTRSFRAQYAVTPTEYRQKKLQLIR